MLHFDLDTPLIEIQGKLQNDIWTIRHAVEGVQIFGGIGSGKSSGSGRFLALKYLRAGFGGLVLTVKPDEREEWIKYCRLVNRIHDLVVISSQNDNFFNFLDYETERNSGGQLTENLVDVLKTVIRAGSEKSHGKSEDPFWENALDMLLFNVIDLCQLAYGKISVRRMYDIVQSIPRLQEDSSRAANKDNTRAYEKAFDKVDVLVRSKLEKWETQNAARLRGIDDRDIYDEIASADVPEYRQMKYLKQFFEDTYIPLSEKTRSIVEFSFSGFLFRLLRDPVYKLFCSNPSNIRPEDCLNGKIILLDLPVKLYDKVGRDAQIMFKYIWQRAMERRDPNNGTRPVFLWADEAQNFLHEHDADYQATARSSRICTVYITQNLPNYYGNMGGQKGEFKVKSFLGTLNTKIFHANSDIETNNYASSLFGDHLMEKISKGSSIGLGNISKSSNTSAEYERAIRPERFISLKTGSPRNQNVVEGFIQRQGEPFANGSNFIKMQFSQNYSP
ncbi:TraM recognition domain-containing protein [Chryseolinea sp. H1M3-3]|uniref:type IV secretory system conjugative DNA transfer family protein n=1 Tax=Chryseolinea sp. H1M3-3 TaxID=3034144 RepID=UPI0023EADA34|nr:TraM recognition domain-containing protein [Chryseolinea sp. H1M3-3]